MAGNRVQVALFAVMVIRAGMLRDAVFEQELTEQIERSPRFFYNAPVVLDLNGADGFASEDEFLDARDMLRRHTLSLVGIQNALPAQLEAAAAAGFASFAPTSTQPSRRPAAPARAAQPPPARSSRAARPLATP